MIFDERSEVCRDFLCGFHFAGCYRLNMFSDCELLRRYAETNSEEAFAELVRRHLDLVYSAALRQVNGDAHLAQEVTQTVFADLARKAESLSRRPLLTGWLYTSAHFAAAKVVRAERRRRAREQEAQTMRELLQDPAAELDWDKLRPVLDEAMHKLKETDREAILLRYFEQRQFAEIGARLGVGENTARMRVERALEKLHAHLVRRGITTSTALLSTAISVNAVQTAPVGLAAALTTVSLSGAAAGTATTLTFLELMTMTKFKAGVISAIVIASVVTPLMVQQQAQVRLRNQDGALRQQTDQLANLQEQNERLSNLLAKVNGFRSPSNDQLSELMRLRGEIGRLQTAVQELTGPKTKEPLSREEVLASMRQMYLGRVDRLKQLFTTNPAEAVPELQFVTDDEWLRLVEYDHHEIDPDNRRVMSLARSGAQIRFAHTVLDHALEEYGKNNGGQFPTDLSLLAPYFKSPVDDSILRNWTILPTSSLPSGMRVDEDWVITQKAPVNAELDQRVVIGMKSARLGGGGTNDWAPVP